MTPSHALQALETIVSTLDRLLPGFHTTNDRADLTEARASLEDVARRLEAEIAQEQTRAEEEAP